MKKVLLLLTMMIVLLSCEPDYTSKNIAIADNNNSIVVDNSTNREIRPVILGKQKNNPFSVKNMKIALDSLIYYAANHNQTMFKPVDFEGIELEATDLYVRFLPQDSIQFATLMNDTSLKLFDFPLDYEIKQNGDFYQDPTVKPPYTWYYTTVKPNYTPPVGIKYEILEQLFILENSPYYSEYIEDKKNTFRTPQQKNYSDIFEYLHIVSFILTGNEKELNIKRISPNEYAEANKTPIAFSTHNNVVWKRFLFWKWQEIETYYYPDGYIKVKVSDKEEVGLKGVTIRLWRWFVCTDIKTDHNGYYRSYRRYNNILINNQMSYRIIFEGQNRDNSWELKASLAGALCLWTKSYDLGDHHPDGYTMTISPDNGHWGRAITNNAIYEYCSIARMDNVSLPPKHLTVATKESSDLTSSAPLLRNHLNWSLVADEFPSLLRLLAQITVYAMFGNNLPDLILRYEKNSSRYKEMKAIIWHELTHASQLQRIRSEKGYWWASKYWSKNVYQQLRNTMERDGDPYGIKGGENWQIIALSEGWANYREQYMAVKYLEEISYKSTYNILIKPYVEMFEKLHSIGCSHNILEKVLYVYTINEYKEALIEQYPYLSKQITEVIKQYE